MGTTKAVLRSQTVYPVDNEALNDGNDKNTESSAVVVHQLENVHATLRHQSASTTYY